MLTFLEDFVDYELEHGTTPADYAWAGVPYASADPGARDYKGWSSHGTDYIEPHVVGEDGYAYLRLYEMTGNTKYLQAAIRCANALVKNYKRGDETHSPWPVRCYAKDGTTRGEKPMGPYSANVIEPIMLFDELILHACIRATLPGLLPRIRQNASRLWFQTYPLTNNVWVGYFRRAVVPSMGRLHEPKVIPARVLRVTFSTPEKIHSGESTPRKLIESGSRTLQNGLSTSSTAPRSLPSRATALSSAATCPINAATATPRAWRRWRRSTSPRPGTWITVKLRFLVVQLGHTFSGAARKDARAVGREPVVVHRRIRRWPAPSDGRFLGGTGVGSDGRISFGRVVVGRNENRLRKKFSDLFLTFESRIDGCVAPGFRA